MAHTVPNFHSFYIKQKFNNNITFDRFKPIQHFKKILLVIPITFMYILTFFYSRDVYAIAIGGVGAWGVKGVGCDFAKLYYSLHFYCSNTYCF